MAEPVVWTGEITLRGFDCRREHRDGIIVRGAVTLMHPDDSLAEGSIKQVVVVCSALAFDPGSEIRSISSLDIRIDGTSTGAIKLVNTRGVNGNAAAQTPDIWATVKMAKGESGRSGADGRDASGCVGMDDHLSENGGNGGRGGDGISGQLYAAAKGASGQKGGTSGDVVFISRFLAAGTTVEISAIGGDGGAGGLGGRGADGGDGGDGGKGGRGGFANSCHTASGGGNGGYGGNGGDGGGGGQGGNGGDGGNGGNVIVAIMEGSASEAPKILNHGGAGGSPGKGGEPGVGGDRGHGGVGGSGGDVASSAPFGSGAPRASGAPGLDGAASQNVGALGVWGLDGSHGRIGQGFTGTLPQNQLDKLFGSNP